MRELFDGGQDQVAQERRTGVFTRTGGSLTITGESVLSAASMIARICSRLLTLKAGAVAEFGGVVEHLAHADKCHGVLSRWGR